MKALPVGMMALVALAAGCASGPPRPTEDMTRARTLIDQAAQSGAQRYAAADLQEARDKLAESDQAANKGDTRAAQWLASESAADAQLAVARAASGKANDAAREVSQDLATLRSQTLEGTTTLSPQTAPPSPPPPPVNATPPQ